MSLNPVFTATANVVVPGEAIETRPTLRETTLTTAAVTRLRDWSRRQRVEALQREAVAASTCPSPTTQPARLLGLADRSGAGLRSRMGKEGHDRQ